VRVLREIEGEEVEQSGVKYGQGSQRVYSAGSQPKRMGTIKSLPRTPQWKRKKKI